MKKIFGLFMLMLLTCNVFAEEIYPSLSPSVLSRDKNKFYYNGERISQRDVQAYLKFNADQDIYKRFRSGRQMYQAGWGLMGIGLTADVIAATVVSGVLIYSAVNGYEMNGLSASVLGVGGVMAIYVLPLQLTAIPLICVGKSKMHKSFDAYNISLSQANFQPELRLQTNNNGIGLVCAF